MNRYHTFWKRLAASIIDTLIFIPYFFLESYDPIYFYLIELSYIILWTTYSVYLHGKYGQTIGKRVLSIKVLDISESSPPGFFRALMREIVWTVMSIGYFLVFLFNTNELTVIDPEHLQPYDTALSIISLTWLIVELLTMLTNPKRRSLHDYIAGTVVVDTTKIVSESELPPLPNG